MSEKVIIIDNSEFYRNMAKSVLEKVYNFEIIDISNKNGLTSILKSPDNISLIIMDIAFPEPQNGIDALYMLRRNESTKKVPVIITTEHDNPTYKKLTLSYNVSDFIKKPYQIKRLENSIRSIIKIEEKFEYNFSEFVNITFSFEEYVSREITSSLRRGHPLSILIISSTDKPELSEFHHHNEKEAIQIASEKIRLSIRSSDAVFLNKDSDIFVILPSTDSNKCKRVLEKVTGILETEFKRIGFKPKNQYFSICVTCPHDGDNLNSLISNAFKKMKDKKSLEEMTSILKYTEKYPNTKYSKYNK